MKNKLFAWAIAWTMVVVINAHAGRFDLHFPNPKSSGSTIVGGVYTMDNAPDGNKVWAFGRRADGSLTAPRKYSTGGAGSGDGLGLQTAQERRPGHPDARIGQHGNPRHLRRFEHQRKQPLGGVAPGAHGIAPLPGNKLVRSDKIFTNLPPARVLSCYATLEIKPINPGQLGACADALLSRCDPAPIAGAR